ncbi:protein C19orf12 homolog [Leptinotarsa decemlineata]|uniref:protein C19orf12 homolog n=1 Tax=Leptinotarsa decemlineata TaxID=7539 RepID=UPI003D30A786
MSNGRRVVLEVCELLCQQENLKATIRESAKGAALVGVTSFLGAIVGGRLGLLAGAALGGAASMAFGSEFKSLVDIIRQDMTEKQREQLAESVRHLFRGIQLTDTVEIMAMLAQNTSLKSSIINGIVGFIQQEMKCSVC